MSNKRSAIPENAQIPLAIALGVVFIFLWAWRLWPKEAEAPASLLLIPAGESAVQVPLDDLRSLLAEIKEDEIAASSPQTDLPPLAKNPFREWDPAMLSGAEDAPDETAKSDAEVEAEREKTLSALQLSATSLMGDTAIAMISGEYYRVGDTVAGFKLLEIREREVLLQDPSGSVKLRMPEAPAL